MSNSAAHILLDFIVSVQCNSCSIFTANLLVINIFTRILPLIYCQIMVINFVIYLLALCKYHLIKFCIKFVSFLSTKFIAKFCKICFRQDLAILDSYYIYIFIAALDCTKIFFLLLPNFKYIFISFSIQ